MKMSADPKLFEVYLAPVLKTAYGTALTLSGSSQDAETLVLETTLRAFQAFPALSTGSRFKLWFLRILIQTFQERNRNLSPGPDMADWERTTDTMPGNEGQAVAITTGNASRTLLRSLNTDQLLHAFSTMPLEYRTICALYFLDDLNYQEIAEIAGCPLETMRVRLHRGRQALLHTLYGSKTGGSKGAHSAALARAIGTQAPLFQSASVA